MSTSKSIILITGANTGLGLLTAKLLSSSPSSSTSPKHYHIILTSRSLSSAEHAIATLTPPLGPPGPPNTTTFSALELDVTNPEAVERAVTYVEREFGYLNVLVNNAGVSPKLGGLRKDAEVAMGVNFVGGVGMTEACRELLRKGRGVGREGTIASHSIPPFFVVGKGAQKLTPPSHRTAPRIIYLSSGLGSIAIASDPTDPFYNLDVTAYRASKAAINMLAVQQAKILGKEGIMVFAVDPGWRATGLSGDAAAAKARGAGDPEGGAQVVVDVVEGRRDADVGKLVHEGGVHPW
ncbi:MAG: hypothetical protein OHK93_001144 [Ramalina farinacea]|uniref:NAD(P)-binding protein n=1 Tax=Ramalina farinacea TaxID=258253 RepID=A0AA43TXE1_9LECA|nr:hypothetical protein [Ramalina farinacea]